MCVREDFACSSPLRMGNETPSTAHTDDDTRMIRRITFFALCDVFCTTSYCLLSNCDGNPFDNETKIPIHKDLNPQYASEKFKSVLISLLRQRTKDLLIFLLCSVIK